MPLPPQLPVPEPRRAQNPAPDACPRGPTPPPNRLSPGTDRDRCSQLLSTSPVQWPAYWPWPAKVEREMTKGRVPRAFTKALGEAGDRELCGAWWSRCPPGHAAGTELGLWGGKAPPPPPGPPKVLCHTEGERPCWPPAARGLGSPHLPLKCWARREGAVLGPPADPRAALGPSLPSILHPPLRPLTRAHRLEAKASVRPYRLCRL